MSETPLFPDLCYCYHRRGFLSVWRGLLCRRRSPLRGGADARRRWRAIVPTGNRRLVGSDWSRNEEAAPRSMPTLVCDASCELLVIGFNQNATQRLRNDVARRAKSPATCVASAGGVFLWAPCHPRSLVGTGCHEIALARGDCRSSAAADHAPSNGRDADCAR
jgi:hypothetical protein